LHHNVGREIFCNDGEITNEGDGNGYSKEGGCAKGIC